VQLTTQIKKKPPFAQSKNYLPLYHHLSETVALGLCVTMHINGNTLTDMILRSYSIYALLHLSMPGCPDSLVHPL